MTTPKLPFRPDPAMLKFFRGEFKQQVSTIRQGALALQTKKESREIVEGLLKAFHALKGAAQIMQFQVLANLSKGWEDYFHHVQKGLQINIDGLQLLQETINQMGAFSDKSDEDFIFQAMQPSSHLELLKSKIEALGGEDKKSINEEEPPKIEVAKAEPKISTAESSESEADASMMDLFRTELENQSRLISHGLILLEHSTENKEVLQSILRSLHSIKGAARVVRLEPVAKLAHCMEDCFVAIQKKILTVDDRHVDIFLKVVDFFSFLAHLSSAAASAWLKQEKAKIDQLILSLESILAGEQPPEFAKEIPNLEEMKKTQHPSDVPKKDTQDASAETPPSHSERFQDREVRIKASSLNHLMGLAGESMVESRWLNPFGESLLRLKKNFYDLSKQIDQLRMLAAEMDLAEVARDDLELLDDKANECQNQINQRLSELELFINNHSRLSDRLYQEIIESRMRPFSDGVEGFPRMVRDLARLLNKKVHFEILGKSTSVDREILEKLEAPLAHLLRNAVDHGIETPEQRISLGKPEEGTIRLEAQHRAGMLSITVSDDGRGLDVEKIRQIILEKGLARPEIIAKLTENELVDFLFLPGFSTVNKITEISGRGVGLDIVQSMVQEVSGTIRVTFEPGKGLCIHLQLPLTLSVLHSLIVKISKESYAFPLARIDRALFVHQENIELIEDKQYFNFEGRNIGLIAAWQILKLEEVKIASVQIPVVIVSEGINSYGIVVDSFIGEKELAVQELDPRLGKVANISSGAFMEDGSPVLIIDVDDIIRSVDKILSEGFVKKLSYSKEREAIQKSKRVLVVDDSITVREVECRLLRNHGYQVETAINGVDGWNALRTGTYDLVVTDVDMPRMNGIELVRAIRSDPRLKTIPVMIISYKERDEDRIQGLEAGANYYLTKSSFHDTALLSAVIDLIGQPK